MLQQVTKIVGMDMGDGGSASRLEKVKNMRRKTLEWAEEGDSARKRSEMERKAEAKKIAEEVRKHEKKRLQQERLQQERLEQERLEQERLEKERLKEQKIKREKRLEAERFEEERRSRKEKRLEIRKWLEEKKNFEDNLKKVKKEEKKQKSGKDKEKILVAIEDIEGKTLIEYEHGKSETGVRVRMISRPEPGDYPNRVEITHSTRYRGPQSGASHRQEGASGNDDSLDDKPKLYRSRGFSDLVNFYESQSKEMKTGSEKVHRATSKSPSKKEKTVQKEAGEVEGKAADKLSTSQHGYRQPHAQQVAETDVSKPGLRQQPQPVAPKTPKRSSSPLVPNSKSFRSESEAKATPSVGTIPNVASKPLSGRPSEPPKNDNVPHQANTKRKISATNAKKEEEPSKPELKRALEKPKEKNTSVVQGEKQGAKNIPAEKPRREEFPRTGPVNNHKPPSAPRIHPPYLKNTGPAFSQDNNINKNVPSPDLPKAQELPKATEPESKPAPRETSPWPRPLRRRLSREDTKKLLDEHVFHDKLSIISEERASQLSGASKTLKGKAPEATSIDHSSVVGECGSTPTLTNASTLSHTSADSLKVEYNPSDRSAPSVSSMTVEYNPSDRSTTTVDSMRVEYSPSDLQRSGCGSTVSVRSIGSMIVELDPNDQPIKIDPPSDISLDCGRGTIPPLSSANTLSNTSADSMRAEYSPSDLSSATSFDSMNVEYIPSAQSELWEDILQRLGVEAEKETGWLVHPDYCGCLGCIKEA